MSTPDETPRPPQTGPQPPVGGQGPDPSAGAPANPYPGGPQQGYPPPGSQQQGYPPPGYQQPGYQAPVGDTSFRMPTDWPKDFHGYLPARGVSGLFQLGTMPQVLKISYIIWLVSAALWLIGAFFGFVFSVIFFSPRGVISALISVALVAILVVCAMKMKEGLQWPRIVLTALTVLSIIMTALGSGWGWVSIAATVLMWLPASSAWLNARAKGLPG